MFCMKCGREVPSEQVFCNNCLETMEHYPVKPGTAVHLPNRESVKKPANRKRVLSAEEQVQQLKLTVKRLIVAIAILTVVLCLATVSLLHTLLDGDTVSIIGKNYTIDTSQSS